MNNNQWLSNVPGSGANQAHLINIPNAQFEAQIKQGRMQAAANQMNGNQNAQSFWPPAGLNQSAAMTQRSYDPSSQYMSGQPNHAHGGQMAMTAQRYHTPPSTSPHEARSMGPVDSQNRQMPTGFYCPLPPSYATAMPAAGQRVPQATTPNRNQAQTMSALGHSPSATQHRFNGMPPTDYQGYPITQMNRPNIHQAQAFPPSNYSPSAAPPATQHRFNGMHTTGYEGYSNSQMNRPDVRQAQTFPASNYSASAAPPAKHHRFNGAPTTDYQGHTVPQLNTPNIHQAQAMNTPTYSPSTAPSATQQRLHGMPTASCQGPAMNSTNYPSSGLPSATQHQVRAMPATSHQAQAMTKTSFAPSTAPAATHPGQEAHPMATSGHLTPRGHQTQQASQPSHIPIPSDNQASRGTPHFSQQSMPQQTHNQAPAHNQGLMAGHITDPDIRRLNKKEFERLPEDMRQRLLRKHESDLRQQAAPQVDVGRQTPVPIPNQNFTQQSILQQRNSQQNVPQQQNSHHQSGPNSLLTSSRNVQSPNYQQQNLQPLNGSSPLPNSNRNVQQHNGSNAMFASHQNLHPQQQQFQQQQLQQQKLQSQNIQQQNIQQQSLQPRNVSNSLLAPNRNVQSQTGSNAMLTQNQNGQPQLLQQQEVHSQNLQQQNLPSHNVSNSLPTSNQNVQQQKLQPHNHQTNDQTRHPISHGAEQMNEPGCSTHLRRSSLEKPLPQLDVARNIGAITPGPVNCMEAPSATGTPLNTFLQTSKDRNITGMNVSHASGVDNGKPQDVPVPVVATPHVPESTANVGTLPRKAPPKKPRATKTRQNAQAQKPKETAPQKVVELPYAWAVTLPDRPVQPVPPRNLNTAQTLSPDELSLYTTLSQALRDTVTQKNPPIQTPTDQSASLKKACIPSDSGTRTFVLPPADYIPAWLMVRCIERLARDGSGPFNIDLFYRSDVDFHLLEQGLPATIVYENFRFPVDNGQVIQGSFSLFTRKIWNLPGVQCKKPYKENFASLQKYSWKPYAQAAKDDRPEAWLYTVGIKIENVVMDNKPLFKQIYFDRSMHQKFVQNEEQGRLVAVEPTWADIVDHLNAQAREWGPQVPGLSANTNVHTATSTISSVAPTISISPPVSLAPTASVTTYCPPEVRKYAYPSPPSEKVSTAGQPLTTAQLGQLQTGQKEVEQPRKRGRPSKNDGQPPAKRARTTKPQADSTQTQQAPNMLSGQYQPQNQATGNNLFGYQPHPEWQPANLDYSSVQNQQSQQVDQQGGVGFPAC